jgi:hypothetical protein
MNLASLAPFFHPFEFVVLSAAGTALLVVVVIEFFDKGRVHVKTPCDYSFRAAHAMQIGYVLAILGLFSMYASERAGE